MSPTAAGAGLAIRVIPAKTGAISKRRKQFIFLILWDLSGGVPISSAISLRQPLEMKPTLACSCCGGKHNRIRDGWHWFNLKERRFDTVDPIRSSFHQLR